MNYATMEAQYGARGDDDNVITSSACRRPTSLRYGYTDRERDAECVSVAIATGVRGRELMLTWEERANLPREESRHFQHYLADLPREAWERQSACVQWLAKMGSE